MLIPQAYDVAWTRLEEVFNARPSSSPGSAGTGPAGSSSPAATAASGSVNSATSASGMVLPANPERACLIIQNNSATGGPTLWFNFGAPAVPNQCFALQAGGSLVIAQPEACPKEALYLSSSGSGSLICAYYQNSIPEPASLTAGPLPLSSDVGAVAWGYAPPPAPSSSPTVSAPSSTSRSSGELLTVA